MVLQAIVTFKIKNKNVIRKFNQYQDNVTKANNKNKFRLRRILVKSGGFEALGLHKKYIYSKQ